MKFLLDQDVYASTARFLDGLGMMRYLFPKSVSRERRIQICSRPLVSKTEFSFPEAEIIEVTCMPSGGIQFGIDSAPVIGYTVSGKDGITKCKM